MSFARATIRSLVGVRGPLGAGLRTRSTQAYSAVGGSHRAGGSRSSTEKRQATVLGGETLGLSELGPPTTPLSTP